jgi:hypothetical protein
MFDEVVCMLKVKGLKNVPSLDQFTGSFHEPCLNDDADDYQYGKKDRAHVRTQGELGYDCSGSDQAGEHDNRPVHEQDRDYCCDHPAGDGQDYGRVAGTQRLSRDHRQVCSSEESREAEGNALDQDRQQCPDQAGPKADYKHHPRRPVNEQHAGKLHADEETNDCNHKPKNLPPQDEDD